MNDGFICELPKDQKPGKSYIISRKKKNIHGLLFPLTHDQSQIPAPSHLVLIQTSNEMINKAENQLSDYVSCDQAVSILLKKLALLTAANSHLV